MLADTFSILLLALLIDAAIGYPGPIFRRIGHPVTWIGALIAALDRHLNKERFSPGLRRFAGACALACIIIITAGGALLVQTVLRSLPLGSLLEAAAASSLFASRSLFEHIRDVANALERGGLEAGRRAVSRVVGRDPESLDVHGVARAAVESLAENASDGVVAPAFWFAVLGLPGLAAYKAINTADSMIGHRTPRHQAFGWASARLDDLVNLPASRLTASLFVLAALFLPRRGNTALPAVNAVRSAFRDARRHRSPNAGWPESAIAGALGLRLAGPRSYGGVKVEDAYMGNGRAEADATDIRRALRLAAIAWALMLASIAFLAAVSAPG
jgi:adenosylcobinamide-phosphate synthase